jgi:hypothetical protein
MIRIIKIRELLGEELKLKRRGPPFIPSALTPCGRPTAFSTFRWKCPLSPFSLERGHYVEKGERGRGL